MKNRMRMLAAVVLNVCATIACAQAVPAGESLDAIRARLGNGDFAQREAAQRELEKVPAAEYERLIKLAGEEKDEEVKARLQVRADDMLRELVQQQAEMPVRVAAHLTGRVVDAAGNPIVGADVRASSPAWGQDLEWGLRRPIKSDAEGRFDLPVPYTEILYYVSAEWQGHSPTGNKIVIAEKNMAVGDIVMEVGAAKKVMKGTLVDGGGAPVVNQKVELLGEYGGSWSAMTDADGKFVLNGVEEYIGQAVPVVHAGKRTVALEIVRGGAMELRLVPAGSISGKVVANGRAVPGATVYVRPWYTSGWQLQATTGADGSYMVADVPPGKFLVTAEAPGRTRRPPRDMDFEITQTEVLFGGAATADIALEAMAIVRGQVLDETGQPVTDAVVGMISTWRGDYRDQWRCVQADGEGRFILATGHTMMMPSRPTDTHLMAFSARGGLAYLPLPDLKAGELRQVTMKMPGSARVSGVVVDAAGKPVKEIECLANSPSNSEAVTGEDGRFDLGRISRPREEELKLILRAPRLSEGPLSIFPMGGIEIASRETARMLYAHQDVTIKAGVEGKELKVTMQPAQLLEFTGVVTREDGKPAANAEVYLLPGNTDPAKWMSVRPAPLFRDGGRDISSGMKLASVKADANGGYTLWAVREEPTSMIVSNSGRDHKQFAIGAYADGEAKLVEKIEVPKEGKVEVAVKLAPGAPRPDITIER